MKQQLRDVSNAPTDTGEDDEEADEKKSSSSSARRREEIDSTGWCYDDGDCDDSTPSPQSPNAFFFE